MLKFRKVNYEKKPTNITDFKNVELFKFLLNFS